MRSDPWIENYSCDEDHDHGSCCAPERVVGEVAEVPEQLHDAVGETERSLAGDRLVHYVNTVAEHLPWVADHGIQEEVLEDDRECEKAEVEHEGRCVVEEDHDS
jgi:hypothetical protein